MLSISEQIDYSNVHQPGVGNITSATTVASATPNINSTTLTTTVINTAINPATGKATSTLEGSPSVQTPLFDYFGQKFITNNVTAKYDATDRTTFTLTYHYQQHTIGEGAANTTGYLSGISNYTINENGGTFGVAVRTTNNWSINGSVEVLYADNVFTPVSPREPGGRLAIARSRFTRSMEPARAISPEPSSQSYSPSPMSFSSRRAHWTSNSNPAS